MPLIHPEGPSLPWRMCSLNQAPGKVGVNWGGAGGAGHRILGLSGAGLRGWKGRLEHRMGGALGWGLEVGSTG